MNVYQKLNDARTRFHALKLEKTGHNKFAGYKYFELGDFLIPALKVFGEVGLCAMVSFDTDKACMTIRNADKPDEYTTIYSPMGSAALKGCHEVQNIGAVETYQRRYLWVAALEIVEHDALDSSEPIKTDTEEPRKRLGVAQDVLASSHALEPEAKAAVETLAEQVKSDFEAYGPQAAFERIEEQGLGDIGKIYLWTLLASNVRSGIKSYTQSTRTKQRVPA